jgi:stage IV sporulation protein A
MENFNVYQDIEARTNGEIYIGVVGPVRTGKSTFITKMMELLVLPNISDENEKVRVTDELPQSGAGRSIMTTQPRFVPGEAIEISLDDKAKMHVRMVDCVGYLIPGAIGQDEDDAPRMVKTPWFDHDIPFEQAAEIGTQKVIDEHATVGIVMTTDGSITDLPREAYVEAEERAVSELQKIGKPFIIVLNSANPETSAAEELREQLQEKYGVSVALVNALNLQREDISTLLSELLYEFPIRQINYHISSWLCSMAPDHWLLSDVLEKLGAASEGAAAMKDFAALTVPFEDADYVDKIAIQDIQLGDGQINIELEVKRDLFYQILGEECGQEIKDDSHLVEVVKALVGAKQQYDKIESAMHEVQSRGYGVVQPVLSEMRLEKPELMQQGNKFGVRLRASAPSMHLVQVDVETEVSPIVGTEEQSQDFLNHLLEEYDKGEAIWQTDIFGKSLYDIIREGLSGKMGNLPEDAREKMQETLSRMVNEGDGGMLCILL